MGKTKSQPRQMNFANAIQHILRITDERSDQKFLENSKQFTMPLASLKARIAALEELAMDKLGETPESLDERVLVSVERAQGFVQVDEPVKLGSIVRIKIKEERHGTESPANPMQDAFTVVGQMQIHKDVDQLLIGMKVGETRDILITNPKNDKEQIRITVFLSRVFKGKDLPANEATQETSAQASSEATQNQTNGETVQDQTNIAKEA